MTVNPDAITLDSALEGTQAESSSMDDTDEHQVTKSLTNISSYWNQREKQYKTWKFYKRLERQ